MKNINAVNRITQYLMLGDIENIRRFCHNETLSDDITAWSLAKIYAPLTDAQKQLLNKTMLAQHDGWSHFYAGDYTKSHEYFITAYHDNTEDSYGANLGLAKVYTRLGHWQAAKQWLLHQLPIARQQNDLFMQAQCYGALGEIFLRANYPKIAYECFGNAFHVLPKGSSQREKQYNYQASALIRTGNTEQAEQYLMSALYLAESKHIDSIWHSLARLQFLWLQQQKTDSIKNHYAEYLQQKPNIAIAEGFLNIAWAFLAEKQHNKPEAIRLANHALHCFNNFPMEKNWTLKILHALNDQPLTITDIKPIQALFPDTLSNLIESPWLTLRLPEQGFAPIQTAQSLEQLWQARLLFFI